jgi:hypothetical protein
MRKHISDKKLVLSAHTLRALVGVELGAAAGGRGKSANGCTKKNSECNGCDDIVFVPGLPVLIP